MNTQRLDTPQRTLYGIHRPQRYEHRDPMPHIKFGEQFPPMQKWEWFAWSFGIGFWLAFVFFCDIPW